MLPLSSEITGDFESYDAISQATSELAEKIDADVIICQTSSGATATAIATQRPNLPIITVTSNPRVAGQLALTYANSAFVRPYSDNYGLTLAKELKESGYLQKREGKDDLTCVIVSGTKGAIGGTNTIRIRNV